MCSGYSNYHSQSNYLRRFTMRHLNFVFQFTRALAHYLLTAIAIFSEKFPITFIFLLLATAYGLHVYTDTPLLIKYSEMQNYLWDWWRKGRLLPSVLPNSGLGVMDASTFFIWSLIPMTTSQLKSTTKVTKLTSEATKDFSDIKAGRLKKACKLYS